MATTVAVLMWILLPALGVGLLAAWRRTSDGRFPSGPSDDRATLTVTVGHLGLMTLAIAAWILCVIKENAALSMIGFTDLIIFAGAGEDLLSRLHWPVPKLRAHAKDPFPAAIVPAAVDLGVE